ncbi:MAG: carbohydrate ABC transporter permease [Clostridia bacterium]|nr:carbohydrate ABC transporter permease [Clostridia bacterium]MBR6795138.1 carbohydrate ABC transporter permease [Clostridia bacterium]
MVTRHSYRWLVFLLLLILAVLFIAPILIVLMNSFKGQFSISGEPFRLPTKETFVGLLNYRNGIEKIDFVSAFAYSLFITVASVSVIILFTSMAAWYIVRRKSFFTKFFYLTLVFSMIVPFQMVMFTMSKIANVLNLENPVGIVLIYLGFGAGLSVFIFSGFVRSLPYALEEAASIDGCNPWQMFFKIIFPMMKPTAVTVAILNAMWIWNDYLLPYLVIGSKYKTIPVAIQYLQGGYGSRDMGALMAMLVLAVLPIIVFYAFAQKFIVKGVIAGAVKG